MPGIVSGIHARFGILESGTKQWYDSRDGVYEKWRESNTTYYWAYEQYGIWGLTARFLVRFKEILLAGEYQPTWKR